jgi:hypothetical protein
MFGERYVYVYNLLVILCNLIIYELAWLSKLINRYNVATDWNLLWISIYFYTESNGGMFNDIAFIESKIWTKTSIEHARSTHNGTCWILSLVKESFRYCVYIPSRNWEKQLCNKAIKSQKKPFWKCVCTRNTATLLVNRPKTVLFLKFNWTDIRIFCFIH